MIEKVMDTDEVQLYRGDCRVVMASLPDNSVDSIVTDPPYELGFMGRQWDSSGIAFDPEVWSQALRVLKPGGHLLAFGGTRTWHRVAVAIEDAGFEIRDSIAWLYGSGFPKSLDVSKAIDKVRDDRDDVLQVTSTLADLAAAADITRADIDAHMGTSDMGGWWLSTLRHRCACPSIENWTRLRDFIPGATALDDLVWRLNGRKGSPGEAWDKREVVGSAVGYKAHYGGVTPLSREFDITAPATPDAARWQGWGTALKPAHEPVVVARKPFQGTVAANVLAYGTGAINIDANRIEHKTINGGNLADNPHLRAAKKRGAGKATAFGGGGEEVDLTSQSGRFPSNVLLDESQAEALDEQTGALTSGLMKARTERAPRKGGTISGADQRNIPAGDTYADSGGTSRFFYVAKAPAHERPEIDGAQHATVKPLTLMRYLVKLVTPPGGTVLEPFAGSGTTLEAAVLEGFLVIGAELDDDGKHIPLILKRLSKPLTPAMF